MDDKVRKRFRELIAEETHPGELPDSVVECLDILVDQTNRGLEDIADTVSAHMSHNGWFNPELADLFSAITDGFNTFKTVGPLYINRRSTPSKGS